MLRPSGSAQEAQAPAFDTTAPLRRWEQIAAELRADIVAGRFAPGARLPNEAQLAERFQVHRHTLRQAVKQLAHEGHVRVVHGSGTYVRELVLDYALQKRTRMTENLAQAGERAQRELLGWERCRAGEWAAVLKLHPQTAVEVMRTRATVRGRPIGLSTCVYPAARCGGIGEAFRALGSITAALERFGVQDYSRASSTVSCRLPTPEEADLLARAVTEPVLVVQFHSVDSAGVPVEAGCTLFAADAVQLTVVHDR
jgi:GntR family phosphonate transport system transcriptional regulator